MNNLKDALGNPIVVGGWYGTSVSYEGRAFVIMGQVATINLDSGTVGVSIARRRKPMQMKNGTWSYGDMKFGDYGFKKRTVAYEAQILFPIPAQESR